MLRWLAGVAVALTFSTAASAQDKAQQGKAEPVTLQARDGVSVSALLYEATQPKAVILLFHQAGSSKAEYATIAPRLVASGYTALAIDQRSGGSLFGPGGSA